MSAIAVAAAGRRNDLFLEVAATVSRFYPRIDEVHLVPRDVTQRVTGSTPLDTNTITQIRAAAERSTGLPVMMPHPTRAQRYYLIKRSPNSDQAVNALALSVDVGSLIESTEAFWSRDNVGFRVSLPDGTVLIQSPGMGEARFSKPLESGSQPLLLETTLLIGIADVLPPLQAVFVLLLTVLIYTTVTAASRQRSRIRDAEQQANLSRMEAQLSHASRVNAMGEMASGMAHELTQPLTAILAQAQARRASEILERLRNWLRPQRAPAAPIDLRDAIRNVRALLTPEAERRGVALRMDTPAHPIEVTVDQVEIEQVVHNVLRNAFDALEGKPDGTVNVTIETEADTAVLEIADNGPGVDDALLSRLYMPFVTTREDGTGLGLALSQRLVERANGTISYAGGDAGAVFLIKLPLVRSVSEAAQ